MPHSVVYKELIITCEVCGNVQRLKLQGGENVEEIFRNFTCKNNCGRNLYSFIAIGKYLPKRSKNPSKE